MHVFVKVYATQKNVQLDVEGTDTIASIKAKLAQTEAVPSEAQRLIYAGQQLDDVRTLQDYDIQKETTLFMVQRTPETEPPHYTEPPVPDYAAPVYPEMAYPNQRLPPSYLMGPPPLPEAAAMPPPPPPGRQYALRPGIKVLIDPCRSMKADNALPTTTLPPPMMQKHDDLSSVVVAQPLPPPAVSYAAPAYYYAPPPAYNGPPPPAMYTQPANPPPPAIEEPDFGSMTVNQNLESTLVVFNPPLSQQQAYSVTHLNFYHNRITRIEGLHQLYWPNLMRLTLRDNQLKSLRGIDMAPNLRWLDASSNNIKDMSGVNQMMMLQWVDLHNNDLSSLRGLGFCPNVTFVNMHHNELRQLDGIEALVNLQFLDVSNNDLSDISGAANCSELVEMNAYSGEIGNPSVVNALARLPKLRRLNIGYNNLDDSSYGDGYASRIQADFRNAGSQATILTAPDFSGGSSDCHYAGRSRYPSSFDAQGVPRAPSNTSGDGCCTVL